MELRKFSEDLLDTMKAHVEQLKVDQPDIALRTSQIISHIESCVYILKQYVLKYNFKDTSEEIDFFKTIKPIFISQLLFYKKIFRIHLYESFSNGEVLIQYYYKLLKSLQKSILRNRDFYHYILSNSDSLDHQYFVRVNNWKRGIVSDDRFSTAYDYRLSMILTNQLTKEYIWNAIEKIQSPSPNTHLTWTGSKTDLIELVYALQALGVFNKSSADIKQVASHFENVFNVTLGNYYRTFQEIRIRKNGQTNFINQLKDVLLKRINESDL